MRFENFPHTIVKLKGLDPEKYYMNETTGEICSGALFMNAGLNITCTANKDGDSEILFFKAL